MVYAEKTYTVQLPQIDKSVDQDEEWILLEEKDEQRRLRIRLHDYAELYSIPGLYEEVVYRRLNCRSPEVVCSMLLAERKKAGDEEPLRVLDFGAGNGIVAERLQASGQCELAVGVDVIPEARDAARRDRPGVYDHYYVKDLLNLDEVGRKELSRWGFNSLVTVAALGFGDIPARAFVNAFRLLPDGAWLAFNIKDRFLSDDDTTGYKDTIVELMNHGLTVRARKRYRHRYSLAGEELYYHAIVGRKKDSA